MAEVQYTKTMVMNTTTGDVTLTQGEAQALQSRLDNDRRYFKVANKTTGVITYYDVGSAACGICKVATITPGTTTATEVSCEDPLPNCPTDDGSDDKPTDGGDDNKPTDGGDDNKPTDGGDDNKPTDGGDDNKE